MANRPKKPGERFYHLRITRHDGPYLDWTCEAMTDDPRRAFTGNAKHTRSVQGRYPLAWVMVRVPSVKRAVA